MTASPLRIEVNGDPLAVPAGTTVAGLLAQLEIDPRRAAVELNRRIVRKPEHATTVLAEGDRVEVVTLVGGG